jgi:hypothetical protein
MGWGFLVIWAFRLIRHSELVSESQRYTMASMYEINNTSANGLYVANNTVTATGANYCDYGLTMGQISNNGMGAGVLFNTFNVTANTVTWQPN